MVNHLIYLEIMQNKCIEMIQIKRTTQQKVFYWLIMLNSQHDSMRKMHFHDRKHY